MQGLESKLLKGSGTAENSKVVWMTLESKWLPQNLYAYKYSASQFYSFSLSHKHAMELCVFLANYSKTLLMQPLEDQGNKVIISMRFPEEKITVWGAKYVIIITRLWYKQCSHCGFSKTVAENR